MDAKLAALSAKFALERADQNKQREQVPRTTAAEVKEKLAGISRCVRQGRVAELG